MELLLPTLFLNIVAGGPANSCIDVGHILRYAFGMFGIRSHLQLVDLMIRDRASGEGTMYGSPRPSWDEAGKVFDGHCVLWLPESLRIIDATVDQFPMVRRLGMGPIIGRAALSIGNLGGETPPPGTNVGVMRGDLMLLYTTAPAEFAGIIDTPMIRGRAESHCRSATNLAGTTLGDLRGPLLRASTGRPAPSPARPAGCRRGRPFRD